MDTSNAPLRISGIPSFFNVKNVPAAASRRR
jgi:hypothetical protein